MDVVALLQGLALPLKEGRKMSEALPLKAPHSALIGRKQIYIDSCLALARLNKQTNYAIFGQLFRRKIYIAILTF